MQKATLQPLYLSNFVSTFKKVLILLHIVYGLCNSFDFKVSFIQYVREILRVTSPFSFIHAYYIKLNKKNRNISFQEEKYFFRAITTVL